VNCYNQGMPDIFVDTKTDQPQMQEHPLGNQGNSIHALIQKDEHSMGLLSAYCLKPQGVSFVNQEPDEKILLFLRRHGVTNVPWILSTVFFFIIPPLFFLTAPLANINLSVVPASFLFSTAAFYYLVVLGYAFGNFVSWFYNVGIVTQKRIMDLDSTNILSHNSATANANEIVDVKFTQQGFFQSTFNYGDIHIQTEAIHANFEFMAAPNPTEVADIISDLRVAHGGGK
jgi:hypothetical protein